MTVLEQHQELFNMLLDVKDFADKQGISVDLRTPMQEVRRDINMLMQLSLAAKAVQ
jgi:hypothetical protein